MPEPKTGGGGAEDGMPDFDDLRMQHTMREIERDMAHLDENNPKHMAHMMPKEMNDAIRRLESGEDPEKIEEDMGEVFDQFIGPDEGEGGVVGMNDAPYARDGGLYDM